MISSMRLRNSGRKVPLSAFSILSWVSWSSSVSPYAAGSPACRTLAHELGAQVGGHDQHGVAEVDHAALAVGHAPVVQDLQQGVPDLGVGLLDLVEEDHPVGAAADGLGQLAALLVADVAGRGAEQAR